MLELLSLIRLDVVRRQTRVLTFTEPEEDGPNPYLFIMDSHIPGGSHSIKDYLVKMYGEKKGKEILSILTDSMARPQTGYEVIQSKC